MSDSKSVSLPTHLWDALDLMSQEMGVGRDELVAQAVFTTARLNGYVVPGRVQLGAGAHANSPMLPTKKPGPPVPTSARARPEPEPEEEPQQDAPAEDEGNPFDDSDGGFNDEDLAPRQHDDGPSDEPMADDSDEPGESEPEDEEPAPEPAAKKGSVTLIMAGREPFKMNGDVMTLGRGKACDFVIDSNRVSREHARIVRDGAEFVLEDLNSSNGTFYGPSKEKVTRARKIKDGDEFTFGTEKVKFQIRK